MQYQYLLLSLFSLFSLFSLTSGYSLSALKRASSRGLAFAEAKMEAEAKVDAGAGAGAGIDTTCSVTLDSLYQSRTICSQSTKSICNVCGPTHIDVPIGGSVIYKVWTNCSYDSFRSSQNWVTPWHVTATVTSSSFGSVTTWKITASDAILGQEGKTTAEWCLQGGANAGYAGLTTTIKVVGQIIVDPTPTPPSTPTPTSTPVIIVDPTPSPTPSIIVDPPMGSTNRCPDGYTMLPSSYSQSPRDPKWCSTGVSSCKICERLGSWQNGVRQVDLALACTPLTQSISAFRSWYAPWNTDISRTWWSLNAGTTWKLTILGGGQSSGDKFNLTNEWCLDQPEFKGYVAANVAISLP